MITHKTTNYIINEKNEKDWTILIEIENDENCLNLYACYGECGEEDKTSHEISGYIYNNIFYEGWAHKSHIKDIVSDIFPNTCNEVMEILEKVEGY